ncbi:MAG: transcription-repair coupling factor, partial [Aestuariivirga sp.]
MIDLSRLKPRLGVSGRVQVSGVPQGLDAMILPEVAKAIGSRAIVHVALDDQRAALLADQLAFFAPELEVLRFPAWDCLPYDRVSPVPDIVARRLATLARLAQPLSKPTVVLATVNAVLQRVVPRGLIAASTFTAAPGNRVHSDKVIAFLAENGFSRTGTVVDPGDFAVRGGIIDIYPPGADAPVRLDFFGDTLESVRSFDPESQRTVASLKSFSLNPANEVLLTDDSIGRFRRAYAEAFGGLDISDPLYESVTSGRRYQGMEHWMPFFHDRLETLFDYLSEPVVTLDHTADEAAAARLEQIDEFYQARREALDKKESFGAAPYKPLRPELL